MDEINKSVAQQRIIKDIEACEECRMIPGVGDRPVFPRGNPNAICMLVGEGPGEKEEQLQKPFVGAAGRLLEHTLTDLGFDINHDFYITNVVKYRSYKPLTSGKKQNKPPTIKQINTERGFLEHEIAMVQPKLIVTLGAKASQWFLGKDFKLTEGHGKLYNWHGITILPTFHPAAVLRSYATGDQGERRHQFEDDLRKIRIIISPEQAA